MGKKINMKNFDYGNEESYQKLHKKKSDDKPAKRDNKRRKKNNGGRKG